MSPLFQHLCMSECYQRAYCPNYSSNSELQSIFLSNARICSTALRQACIPHQEQIEDGIQLDPVLVRALNPHTSVGITSHGSPTNSLRIKLLRRVCAIVRAYCGNCIGDCVHVLFALFVPHLSTPIYFQPLLCAQSQPLPRYPAQLRLALNLLSPPCLFLTTPTTPATLR